MQYPKLFYQGKKITVANKVCSTFCTNYIITVKLFITPISIFGFEMNWYFLVSMAHHNGRMEAHRAFGYNRNYKLSKESLKIFTIILSVLNNRFLHSGTAEFAKTRLLLRLLNNLVQL